MTDFSIDDVEGIPQRPSFLQFYMHPYTYVWPALWRQQSKESVLQEESDSDNNLKKCLNWLDLLTYGIASTVGAGIFVTLGTVVAGNINAGPSTIFSFLIAGLASLISAFCYSEFAARIPVSGSAYTFSYIALGEFVGWLIGWNLTLEYAISAAAVARGWATYVVAFFQNLNVELPDFIAGTTVDGFVDMGPLTVYIIILCTLIILIGMKESAIFNIIMTIINISLILFIIITGATKVHAGNWTPFFPNGFSPILTGAGTLFFSYIGFDAVSTLAGEVQKPARDLPIGIVGTLGVATVLYVAVTLVITGMVPYTLVNVNAPLADAFQSVGYSWASTLVAAGSITTLTATTLTSLIGQPRIFLQMAKDGLLWDIFGKVNARQVPVFGTLVTAIGAAFIGFFLNLAELSDMISIGTLMAFTIVCAGVVILRVRPPPGTPDSELKKVLGIHPRWVPVIVIIYILLSVVMGILINYGGSYYSLILVAPLGLIYGWIQLQTVWDLPETFKCPLVPLIPLIGVAVNVVVIFSLPIFAVYRVIIWSAIGLAIYFFFGIRNSKLNQPNYHAIQKEDNKL